MNLEKNNKIALTNNKASMLNTPKEFSTRDLINKKISKDEPTILKNYIHGIIFYFQRKILKFSNLKLNIQ